MGECSILRFESDPFPAYISSGRVVYRAGDKHPKRIFPTFVAMFIEQGTLYFTENNTAYTLTPGQWYIQTPGLRHYGHRPCDGDTVFHYVHFLPQGKWSMEADTPSYEQLCPPVQQIDGGREVRIPKYELSLPMQGTFPVSEWGALFDALQAACLPGEGAIAKQAEFLRLLDKMVHYRTPKAPAGDPVRVVLAYIQQHYAEGLTVVALARRFAFSPDQLTRKIRETTGMAPYTLITQHRINKAKRLLVYTNKPILEIAAEIGYNDIAVFSRMFKKYVGQCPTQYRAEQAGLT